MTDTGASSKRTIVVRALARVALVVPLMLLLVFLPAGTLDYWEAWGLLTVLTIPGIAALVYLARRNPELLERRMKSREPEADQRLIMRLALLPVLLSIVIPGLDRRFGWSDVPSSVVFAAWTVVLAGYCVFLVVIRANPWASRVVEIMPGQTVVATGPYAIVRHPMYAGALLIYIAVPLALGSWWAIVSSLLLVPVIVARILSEEAVLQRDLAGYRGYMDRVRWRLVPGLW